MKRPENVFIHKQTTHRQKFFLYTIKKENFCEFVSSLMYDFVNIPGRQLRAFFNVIRNKRVFQKNDLLSALLNFNFFKAK